MGKCLPDVETTASQAGVIARPQKNDVEDNMAHPPREIRITMRVSTQHTSPRPVIIAEQFAVIASGCARELKVRIGISRIMLR